MKKITLLLSVVFTLAFGLNASAQFGCDSAVVIADGFTATGITTPGTGGLEDWNDPNPAGCASNAFYWDDDVYLYQYTAGANDEEISMTIFSRNGWNGIGVFSDCTGTELSGCLTSANSVGGNVTQNVIANAGAGVTVYIAIGQWGAPNDLDFDVTEFVATPLVDPPACTAVTAPADGAIDVLETEAITWDQALGGATGYLISIGTSSGATDVLDNFDVGNALTYTPSPPLAYATEFFVTITPYNSNGNATGCPESSFTLRDAPPEGSTCGNPIVVPTPLPYSTDDDTANYGDDYSGGPGANCGSTSGYLGGDDVVYAYTPDMDTSVTVTLTPGGTWSGLFIYTDCADIGTTCADGVANSSQDIREIVLPVTAGTTYYIVVSTWPAPQSITYNLTITENTCTNPVATYDVRGDCETADQFFVDVDVTDLGSATTLTVSDNQGSLPEIIMAPQLVTFGPFPNSTPVEIAVANVDDINCILNSPVLTQDFCQDFVVDCAVGPVNTVFCYFDDIDDDPSVATFTYTSSDGSPLNFVINAGQMETCCDELVILDSDGSELFNQNIADPTGISFQSSGDTISWYVNSDGSVNCQDNGYTPFDVTVSCATCVNPVATYDVRSDCENSPQFFVDVDVTDLGSAGTLTVSDDQGSTPQTINTIGLVSFGPFANSTPVVITVANDDDVNCVLTSTALTQDYCLDNIVDCDLGPVNTTFCYFDDIDDDPSVATFTYTSSNGLPLNFVINAGQMEGCCDELVILDSDGSELFNQNVADPTGISFQSSGDTISWYINSDGSVNCQDNGYTPFDVTVSCATCINPDATYQVVDDCENGDQFLIDVIVTSLGDANSLTISNNIDASTEPVTAVGTYQIGPFPFMVDVVVTLSSDDDVNCVINSSAIQLLACPPENDNPCNATVAVVNDNSTCDLTTPGTLIEATDSGVPTGTCAGNPDDDVWFQFTALSEVQLISLVNVAGGGFNTDIALYEGDCDALVELECSDADAMVSPELVIGNTYYIRVFSGGSGSETTTFDLCIQEAPTNIICENAVNFCAEAGGALTTSNIIGIPDPTDIACLFSAPNPTWNIIQIGNSGLIEIEINQVDDTGGGLDVDFVLWGPFMSLDDACGNLDLGCPNPGGDCPNNTSNPDFYPFGNIVDCSYSIQSTENLTIDNAQSGEIYVLLVTNFSDDPGTISISQTNSGDPGDGDITAEIEVDLGPDQSFCGFPDYTINIDSPFADIVEWYANGFIIEGETGTSLTVTETNTYTAIVYDEQCDAQAQDSVTIVFGQEAMANPVPDIVTCDDISADEIEDFDLEIQTAGVLGTQSAGDFNVTYHLTLADAQGDVNPLMSPYTNIMNPQTIYIRVEDADAEFCFATTSFNLIISGPTPTANADVYPECDDDMDGIAAFDLPTRDANILGGQSAADFTVTYYATLADAEAGTNPIDTSMLYNSPTATIYARVESNTSFDCYATTTLDLVVNLAPDATFTLMDLITCDDPSNDGIAEFNLEIQTPTVLGAQDPSDVNVTYHLTLIDAQLGMGALVSPYTNISNPQTIYVRAENANAPVCFVTASFDLIISGPQPDATNVPIEECEDDVASGMAFFDLAAHDTNVLNGQDPLMFSVSYYETEADAEAGVNPINTSVLYESTSQTIYARVESVVAVDCYSTTAFDLIVKPRPVTTFSTDFDYEVCPNATTPILVTATPENYSVSDVSIVWYRDGGVIGGETGLTLSVMEAGLYEIEVTFNDSTMCSAIVAQEVVELESCVIPQGISPNGDGSNDTFDLSSYDVSKLEIFNRHGTLVYSKTNYKNEWYGQTNDGDELPVGTYFYTMEYQNGKRRAAWVYIQRLN